MHIQNMHFACMTFDDRPDAAKRLQQAREARNFKTPKEAATYFGWTYETYIQHEQGTRGISRAAAKYAKAFRVSEGWLLTGEGRGPGGATDDGPSLVPIDGKAGAGPDGSVLFAETQGGFGEAEAPMNATENTRALEVEGVSMRGVAEDGSLIFYDSREPPSAEHIGELCVCWLENGKVLVKYPFPGSSPGLWNLESTTAPTLRDQVVREFAHIINIVPRRAAQKLVRRRPDIEPSDVVISR